VTVADLEPVDGTIEPSSQSAPERSFPAVFWRRQGESFESFFVRPHQVGNPDAIQYLARVNGLDGDRDTALARTVIRSEHAATARLDLGFSDSAVVYLNGRAL
jgi:hypothetical protein